MGEPSKEERLYNADFMAPIHAALHAYLHSLRKGIEDVPDRDPEERKQMLEISELVLTSFTSAYEKGYATKEWSNEEIATLGAITDLLREELDKFVVILKSRILLNRLQDSLLDKLTPKGNA